MLARLTIISGKRSGESLDLPPGEHQIGTGRAAEIQLRDKDVGFKHAKIVVEEGQVFLEDLKSKAGTFVNGERVENRVPLKDSDELRLGTAELRIAISGGAAPRPAEPEVPLGFADEAPEPIAEPAPEPEAPPPAAEPEPALERSKAEVARQKAAEALAARGDVAAGATPKDVDQLQELVRDLRRELAKSQQENKALTEALEASASTSVGGYAPSVAEDLEARNLELQQIADEKAALVLERDEEINALRREIDRAQQKAAEVKAASEKQKSSMASEVERSQDRLQEWRGEVEKAKADVATFEEANSELLLENEELKERVAALQFQVEQHAADRGALVRERIKELQKEVERLELSNAELRTLSEAYEEKIDELDERVEELEGENEALEKLIAELREEINRVKTERDTMVKTLRQKLKRLEDKADGLEGDRARAQAAAARSAEPADQPV